MKRLKKFVTCDEREKAKQMVLQDILNKFKDTAITNEFIKTLLIEIANQL